MKQVENQYEIYRESEKIIRFLLNQEFDLYSCLQEHTKEKLFSNAFQFQ